MFNIHPNSTLQRLFRAKPYQGAPPTSAQCMFVGLDANYTVDIATSIIFPDLVKYLQDGPKYWKATGTHHPFLLDGYKGDGRFYHESFQRIGLDSTFADKVSFIELLDVPTFGRSSLEVGDLRRPHLKRLRQWIAEGPAGCVFMPSSVGRLLRKSGQFPELRSRPSTRPDGLRFWGEINGTPILWHYHFSVYGKFEKAKRTQLRRIGELIRQNCRTLKAQRLRTA